MSLYTVGLATACALLEFITGPIHTLEEFLVHFVDKGVTTVVMVSPILT